MAGGTPRALGSTLLAALMVLQAASAVAAPWSVLFDHGGLFDETRSLRAVQLSADEATLYIGWLHGPAQRGVWRLDAHTYGTVLSTYDLGTIQANAIATDDRGYVYIGYGENGGGLMEIRNATLASQIAGPFTGGNTTDVEGLDIWKDGANNYFLYVSRMNGVVERYDVNDPSAPALDTSWATGGVFTVNDRQLRGLALDGAGTLFVAQRDTSDDDRVGYVYRISPSLDMTSIEVTGAMDVAFYGGNIYVSQYLGFDSAIQVFRADDLSYVETILTGIARQEDDWGYSGLDIGETGGWFYMSDQWYDVEGTGPDKQYHDRILTTFPIEQGEPIPEPGTLALLAAAGLGLVRRSAASRRPGLAAGRRRRTQPG